MFRQHQQQQHEPVRSVDFDVEFHRRLIDVVSLTPPMLFSVAGPGDQLQVRTRVQLVIVGPTVAAVATAATLGRPDATTVSCLGLWSIIDACWTAVMSARPVVMTTMTPTSSRVAAKQVAYVARPASP